MKNSSHLLKRNANKRAGKKATLQQHQMEIGSICLFICKYYLPLYVSPSPSWHIHTRTYIHMYANIWQLLCAVFVAYAIARGVQWRLFVYRQKKGKEYWKNTLVFFGNFQFKLWLNFARTNAKVATVQILGIYSNLLISRIKCRNRRRVSHNSCLGLVFRVLPASQPARYLLCKFIFDYLLPKICFRLCKCVKPKTHTHTHRYRDLHTCSAARR